MATLSRAAAECSPGPKPWVRLAEEAEARMGESTKAWTPTELIAEG